MIQMEYGFDFHRLLELTELFNVNDSPEKASSDIKHKSELMSHVWDLILLNLERFYSIET